MPFPFIFCEMVVSYFKECTQRSHIQRKTEFFSKTLSFLLILSLIYNTGPQLGSRIISKVRLIPYAVALIILNQQLIFFSTIPYSAL